jgi:RNA polymerase sigma-70 factor (ECF subfamily)
MRLLAKTHDPLGDPAPRHREALGSGAGSGPSKPDAEVFRRIFEEHIAAVWRLLRGLGVPAAQVDDVAQEVFLIVHDKLGEFEGRSRLSTWIFSIAYRVGANARRKVRRAPPLVELNPSLPGGGVSPEEASEQADFVRQLDVFCSGLSVGMRDVFVLCFVEELSFREAAEVLEISDNTVASRVRLLKTSLRELLAERGKGALP